MEFRTARRFAQGVCCVDEFDKMSAQHGALLEAMEQQSVSVAKAGLLCRLPARAAVLAAANPVGGHFDRSRTLGENLRMPAALISRFDLVFVLTDKPDQVIAWLEMIKIESFSHADHL